MRSSLAVALAVALAACTGAVDDKQPDTDADGRDDTDDASETDRPDDTDRGDTDGGETDLGDDTDAPGDTDPGVTDADGDGLTADVDCDDDDDQVGLATASWFPDADGDGVGVGAAVVACTAPPDHAALDGDCDDADAAVFPGAPELCDGRANGCGGAWSVAAEDERVSWEDDDGAWSDVTSAFAGAYTLPGSGTVHVCPGTYTSTLLADVGASVTLVGRGEVGDVVLDGGGTDSVLHVLDGAVVEARHLTFTGGRAAVGGGVAVDDGGEVVLEDVVFDGNEADDGGGLFVDVAGRATVTDATFDHNVAIGRGGAVFAAGTLALTRVFVEGNEAESGGGLALVGTDAVTLEEVEANGNFASVGGAVHLHSVTGTLGSLSAFANAATRGGGIAITGVATDVLVFDGVEVVFNLADEAGGGLWTDLDGELHLVDVQVTDNMSGADGAGLYVAARDGSLDIEGGTFRGNGADRHGGGLFVADDEVVVRGATVEENYAELGGGGLATEVDLTLDGVTVARNRTGQVGVDGPFRGSGVLALGGHLDVRSCKVLDNSFQHLTSDSHGAGLYVIGTATLADTLVEGGEAYLGGGVYVQGGPVKLVDGTVVRDNIAEVGGGAYVASGALICNGDAGTDVGLLGNAAARTDGGAAVFLAGSDPTTRFTGDTCDLGDAGTPRDNTAGAPPEGKLDVAGAGTSTSIGDDATFVCDAESGC